MVRFGSNVPQGYFTPIRSLNANAVSSHNEYPNSVRYGRRYERGNALVEFSAETVFVANTQFAYSDTR